MSTERKQQPTVTIESLADPRQFVVHVKDLVDSPVFMSYTTEGGRSQHVVVPVSDAGEPGIRAEQFMRDLVALRGWCDKTPFVWRDRMLVHYTRPYTAPQTTIQELEESVLNVISQRLGWSRAPKIVRVSRPVPAAVPTVVVGHSTNNPACRRFWTNQTLHGETAYLDGGRITIVSASPGSSAEVDKLLSVFRAIPGVGKWLQVGPSGLYLTVLDPRQWDEVEPVILTRLGEQLGWPEKFMVMRARVPGYDLEP